MFRLYRAFVIDPDYHMERRRLFILCYDGIITNNRKRHKRMIEMIRFTATIGKDDTAKRLKYIKKGPDRFVAQLDSGTAE